MSTTSSPVGQLRLQHAFVAVLFALAATMIAETAAAVLFEWKRSGPFPSMWPLLSHAALSLGVVAMSWVEWSRFVVVQEGLNEDHLETAIQSRFFLLIVDVVIVILYFLLAREGRPSVDSSLLGLSTSGLVDFIPDPKATAFWCMMIMLSYLAYDLFCNVIQKGVSTLYSGQGESPWSAVRRKKWRSQRIADLLVGLFASACVALYMFALYLLTPDGMPAMGSIWLYVALLGAFSGFRLLKLFEHGLAKLLTHGDPDYFAPRKYGRISAALWGTVLVVGFVGFLVTRCL